MSLCQLPRVRLLVAPGRTTVVGLDLLLLKLKNGSGWGFGKGVKTTHGGDLGFCTHTNIDFL